MDELERGIERLAGRLPSHPTHNGSEDFSIGFVCTANRFRSVLAAAVATRALEALPVRVHSAGIQYAGGAPPLRVAREVGASFGLDLAEHRAEVLAPGTLSGFDLVVGFELAHVASAVVQGGAERARTFTLRELVALVESTASDESLDWSSRAQDVLLQLDARPRWPRTAWQIRDPVGESRARQVAMAREIADLTCRLLCGFFGAADVRPPARLAPDGARSRDFGVAGLGRALQEHGRMSADWMGSLPAGMVAIGRRRRR
jgi:protein-tyrosine-phosphatase